MEHSPHMPRAFLLKLLSSSLAAVFVPAIPAARTLDRVTADICDAEPRELQQLNSHIAEMLAEINLPQCGGAVKLQHFAQGSAMLTIETEQLVALSKLYIKHSTLVSMLVCVASYPRLGRGSSLRRVETPRIASDPGRT